MTQYLLIVNIGSLLFSLNASEILNLLRLSFCLKKIEIGTWATMLDYTLNKKCITSPSWTI